MLDSWFLKYILDCSWIQAWMEANAHGAAQKGLYLNQVAGIKIPVPPLPVQREIVRILDNFTELTARQKQYEYYRDKLLTFENHH